MEYLWTLLSSQQQVLYALVDQLRKILIALAILH